MSLNLLKCLSALSSSMLFLFSLGACAESQQEREPETYLLPKDYVGAFYIVFNVAEGEPVHRQAGARIYDIPESGVLLTQGNTNEGVAEASKIRFLRYAENEERVEIKDRWTTSIGDEAMARDDPKTYVFGGGLGIFSRSGWPCKISYAGFHIGTKGEILELTNNFNIADYLQERSIDCADISESR